MAPKKSSKAKGKTKPQNRSTRNRNAAPVGVINREATIAAAAVSFSRGDRVHLIKNVQECGAGSEGVVAHVGQDGYVTVNIEFNERCEQYTLTILAPASSLQLGSRCS